MSVEAAKPRGGPGEHALRWIVKITVSAALMVFLLHKVSLAELAAAVRQMDRTLLAWAVAVYLASCVAGWYQWHALLRASGVDLDRRVTFRFYFVGLFFNNFLPANIGGDVVKVYDVSRLGSSPFQVIAVTVLDRLLGVFSLCVLAAAADLFLLRRGPHYVFYLAVFTACMVPAVGLYFVRPLGNWLRRSVLRMRRLGLDRRATLILDHLSPFKGRRGLVARLAALSVFIQALRVFTHVLVGMSLGIRLDGALLGQFFVFVPLLSLAMIPPITINGLGIREGLGILLFAEAGIGRTHAFTLEFLTYVISVAVSLIGFAFFVARRVATPRNDRFPA